MGRGVSALVGKRRFAIWTRVCSRSSYPFMAEKKERAEQRRQADETYKSKINGIVL
jgi:hypothetical protein